MLTRLPACCLLCLVLTPLQAAEKAPDLGFDYQTLFKEHMQFVAEGKGGEAIEVLEKNAFNKGTFTAEFKDTLKKKLAIIYGGAGKVVNHEVVGYKRISSRIYRFAAVTHFEMSAVTYYFTIFKTGADVWKISGYGVSDGVDELEKLVPFVPVRSE